MPLDCLGSQGRVSEKNEYGESDSICKSVFVNPFWAKNLCHHQTFWQIVWLANLLVSSFPIGSAVFEDRLATFSGWVILGSNCKALALTLTDLMLSIPQCWNPDSRCSWQLDYRQLPCFTHTWSVESRKVFFQILNLEIIEMHLNLRLHNRLIPLLHKQNFCCERAGRFRRVDSQDSVNSEESVDS